MPANGNSIRKKYPHLKGLSTRLRKYRSFLHLTQLELSVKSGEISEYEILALENMRTADIGIARLSVLCKTLQIPMCALLTDIAQPFIKCDFPGFTELSNFEVINQQWSWTAVAAGAAHNRWQGLTKNDLEVLTVLEHFRTLSDLCLIRAQKDNQLLIRSDGDNVRLIKLDLKSIQSEIADCRKDLTKLVDAGVIMAQTPSHRDIDLSFIHPKLQQTEAIVDSILAAMDSESIEPTFTD